MQSSPGGFSERFVVVAGGARMRYLAGGEGVPVLWLDAHGLEVTTAHEILSRSFRVVVLDTKQDPPRSRSSREVAAEVAEAARGLGLERYNVIGSSRGAAAALWLALDERERVLGLVLEAPLPVAREADGEMELSARLLGLATPTLVLLGTADTQTPAETGHLYKQTLPDCHLVLVYAAGHAIAADRPEAFAEVTADFLERHEAFIISRDEKLIHP